MKNKSKIIRVLLMTILPFIHQSCKSVSVEEPSQISSPIAPYTHVTLDNGLDVIVKEVHTAPIVAVYLWCNTGSVNETPHEQGISHFYEHMFFKGTEKRGVGEIDRAIKSLGGYNNAFTSNEYTSYYVVLPSENFSLAADVLIDAIRNSEFPQEEIEKELGVIKEEINRKEDEPTGKLYEEMFARLFTGTQYEHPVLGSKETVSGITRDDFKNYLAKFYVPNNMSAIVIGDVDTNQAIEEIRRLTVDWKPDPSVEDRIEKFSVAKRDGIQEFTLEKDIAMSYVMMAFQTEGYQDHYENAALDVASSILSEGHSSRLYRRLVEEEQLVSSVQAFIYPLRHTGLFVIFATMETDKIPAYRASIAEEIEKLRAEPIGADELEKVKTMLKADYQFSNETDSDIAYTIGHYNTLGMLERVTEYENSIDAVTSEDVSKYVSKELNLDSYTIGIVNPREPSNEEVPGE